MQKKKTQKGEPRKIRINDKAADAPMPGEVEEPAQDSMPAGADTTPEGDTPDIGPETELEALKLLNNELNDRYLRLYAETENFKKRLTRESAENAKYYTEGLVRELLPVVDNLERALGHAGEDSDKNGSLAEGVRLVLKQLTDALGKTGVRKIDARGKPFDPEFHQAMMQVETREHEHGTVVDEAQSGYMLNDRVIRPAMVTVAKRPTEE